jgi:hypothetical protein
VWLCVPLAAQRLLNSHSNWAHARRCHGDAQRVTSSLYSIQSTSADVTLVAAAAAAAAAAVFGKHVRPTSASSCVHHVSDIQTRAGARAHLAQMELGHCRAERRHGAAVQRGRGALHSGPY